MNKIYCVKFAIRKYDCDGYFDDQILATYRSNCMIPIPRKGETVLLDDDEANMYRVLEVDNIFPYQANEIYQYEADVILEIIK